MRKKKIVSKTKYKGTGSTYSWNLHSRSAKTATWTDKDRAKFNVKLKHTATLFQADHPVLAGAVKLRRPLKKDENPFLFAYARSLDKVANLHRYISDQSLTKPQKIPTLELAIARHRNGIRHKLWMECLRFEGQWAEHTSLSDEEREKVEKIVDLMADLLDSNNWNAVTHQLKQTQKL